MNAVLKDIFENVFFCCFLAFILNALGKDKLLPLVIYFAVSCLTTKHKYGGAVCDCRTGSLRGIL